MTDKEIYERQEDVISNLNIFGLEESMWASGYPMATEIRNIDDPSFALDVYCFCGYDDKMYSNSGQGHTCAENCINEFPAELLRNTVVSPTWFRSRQLPERLCSAVRPDVYCKGVDGSREIPLF